MIVSASRRTDIPACYSDWFFNRIRNGYCMVSNPYNPKQIKRVDLSPEAVDGFVFWTKDPAPMLPRLNELENYNYYFTFTLTPYDKEIEPGFLDKATLLKTFKDLSLMIGAEKVIWRYDPVILNDKYSIDFHIDKFWEFSEHLSDYTNKCVISFVDEYRSISKALASIGAQAIPEEQMIEMAEHFSKAALKADMKLATCCESIDLSPYGIAHNSCIDSKLLSQIAGRQIKAGRDKNQRENCGCAASIDIGVYDTCPKGCLYCYATHSKNVLSKNLETHNAYLPGLII